MPPKKTKFVNINAKDCSAPLLPGRQKCECQAVKHDLLNNCLSCGRVVCVQEGAGPCFFCSEIVMNKSERLRYQQGTPKEVQKLLNKYNKLQKPVDDEKRKLADEQKEKLLEFDKNSVKRTHVIDDQADYFSAENPWLTEEEKVAVKQKQQNYLDSKSKLKGRTSFTIDLCGRKIIEEAPKIQSMQDFNTSMENKSKKDDKIGSDMFDNQDEIMKPEFVGQLEKTTTKETPILWSSRIQDAELQEMVDPGNCLSVLQPYASLIVEGIKTFEGRNWYTPVRGRLWISAGGKPPTIETVDSVAAIYTHLVKDFEMPSSFPTGCLLGCVDLIDCLPQEEFRELYPNGEVADPFVLVLVNAQMLPVKMPIQGKPRIFKLDPHIHQAAKKSINKTM